MRPHWLGIASASCAVAFGGCSPGKVVRCGLPDLLTPDPGPQPADTTTVAGATETAPVYPATL